MNYHHEELKWHAQHHLVAVSRPLPPACEPGRARRALQQASSAVPESVLPIQPAAAPAPLSDARVSHLRRTDVLGGLIHEYRPVA
jgi:hypothetical protein